MSARLVSSLVDQLDTSCWEQSFSSTNKLVPERCNPPIHHNYTNVNTTNIHFNNKSRNPHHQADTSFFLAGLKDSSKKLNPFSNKKKQGFTNQAVGKPHSWRDKKSLAANPKVKDNPFSEKMKRIYDRITQEAFSKEGSSSGQQNDEKGEAKTIKLRKSLKPEKFNYQHRPHIEQIYKSYSIVDVNLKDFVCTREGTDVVPEAIPSPAPVYFIPDAVLKNTWIRNPKVAKNDQIMPQGFQEELAKLNDSLEIYKEEKLEKCPLIDDIKSTGRPPSTTCEILDEKIEDLIHKIYDKQRTQADAYAAYERNEGKVLNLREQKKDNIQQMAQHYNYLKPFGNLVVDKKMSTKKLRYFDKTNLKASKKPGMHPTIEFREAFPYIHVTLTDKTADVVHWDAVYSMRKQKNGIKFDPSFGYQLQSNAKSFHGLQQKIMKICPQQSELVPRTYVLNVEKWPSKNSSDDFIGKAVYQSFLYADEPPDFTVCYYIGAK